MNLTVDGPLNLSVGSHLSEKGFYKLWFGFNLDRPLIFNL